MTFLVFVDSFYQKIAFFFSSRFVNLEASLEQFKGWLVENGSRGRIPEGVGRPRLFFLWICTSATDDFFFHFLLKTRHINRIKANISNLNENKYDWYFQSTDQYSTSSTIGTLKLIMELPFASSRVDLLSTTGWPELTSRDVPEQEGD